MSFGLGDKISHFTPQIGSGWLRNWTPNYFSIFCKFYSESCHRFELPIWFSSRTRTAHSVIYSALLRYTIELEPFLSGGKCWTFHTYFHNNITVYVINQPINERFDDCHLEIASLAPTASSEARNCSEKLPCSTLMHGAKPIHRWARRNVDLPQCQSPSLAEAGGASN